MRWFRFYYDSLNDSKVQSLSPETYKFWVNCLCLASQNDGVLPHQEDIGFALRLRMPATLKHLEKLRKSGLLDDNDGALSPHNWDGRQFKSDTSNERVKRHRKRSCNVTGAVTVAPPDTDTDTDTEKRESKTAGASSKVCAFEGRSIRLTQGDLDQWAKSYPNIPSIVAELQAADDYYTASKPKDGKIYHRISNWLKRRDGECQGSASERKRERAREMGHSF